MTEPNHVEIMRLELARLRADKAKIDVQIETIERLIAKTSGEPQPRTNIIYTASRGPVTVPAREPEAAKEPKLTPRTSLTKAHAWEPSKVWSPRRPTPPC